MSECFVPTSGVDKGNQPRHSELDTIRPATIYADDLLMRPVHPLPMELYLNPFVKRGSQRTRTHLTMPYYTQPRYDFIRLSLIMQSPLYN
ncbi:hypothetical protein Pmar_PMAR024377 [Perkinsus marinus ATCC 50983]|uniref:Uncharacterized protein n=1 Tax=Perkinsus marinus (strain ATCC 50983 / TXsc) TaxID=423536 RepID=C5KLX5_PERM5|nr:hypothetical protein Pmar_PMAR024377 [Perkinsus marinus ATCC 50983]EER14490.1 hypothetical protein Pmar_PMAR024377 [Perkinsus marinus ATCC 50983]|eukprot:XP_002782695.1 hypothetical protein Pmar_PMAR024377 [Perkinsus marinus ATCC 50983]